MGGTLSDVAFWRKRDYTGLVTALLFIAGILATYRLSLMLSKESGPMRIFRKIRNIPPPKSAAKEGLSCPLCSSVWFAAIPAVFFCHFGYAPWSESWLWWLSFSGGAVLLHLRDTF